MSLKDFLKNEKEERKKRRQLQKEKKKRKLTGEEKKYKIFGIILGIVVTFGAVFYSCNSCSGGDYTWEKLIGIDSEIQTALETHVLESEIAPRGRINDKDVNDYTSKLAEVGINLQDESDDISPSKDFKLSSRMLGALSNTLMKETNFTAIVDVIDLEFYMIGEVVYQKSIVIVDLSTLIIGSTLPQVYLTSTSKVEVLDNELVCMSNDVVINNFDKDLNEKVLSVLRKSSTSTIEKIGNDGINLMITLFAESIACDMVLGTDCIEFKLSK